MKWTPPSCDSIGIDVPESLLGRKKEEPMEKHNVVAVDIAKAVFELAVSREAGRVCDRRRLSRGAFLVYLAQVPKGTVVIA